MSVSFFFRLDWQREDEENFEKSTIPKSACRLISAAYHSFRVTFAEKISPNGFNRDLIFSFFCIKTKGQRKKVRFLSDNSVKKPTFALG